MLAANRRPKRLAAKPLLESSPHESGESGHRSMLARRAPLLVQDPPRISGGDAPVPEHGEHAGQIPLRHTGTADFVRERGKSRGGDDPGGETVRLRRSGRDGLGMYGRCRTQAEERDREAAHWLA